VPLGHKLIWPILTDSLLIILLRLLFIIFMVLLYYYMAYRNLYALSSALWNLHWLNCFPIIRLCSLQIPINEKQWSFTCQFLCDFIPLHFRPLVLNDKSLNLSPNNSFFSKFIEVLRILTTLCQPSKRTLSERYHVCTEFADLG
jgi:hypothetical protein